MKATFFSLLALVVLSAAILSFSPKPGGEGFEIYLNTKLLVQQYGNKMNDVKSITLDQSSYNGQLEVKYFHCGHPGKNRIIEIKNGENSVVKKWIYGDAARPDAAMACRIKELFALQKSNTGSLNLFYSATELPKGRLLAKIEVTNKDVTSK